MRVGVYTAAMRTGETPDRDAGPTAVEAWTVPCAGFEYVVYVAAPGDPGTIRSRSDLRVVPLAAGAMPLQELADANPDRLDALLGLDAIGLIAEGSAPPAKSLR